MAIKNSNESWLSNVGAVSIGNSLKDYNEVINEMVEVTEKNSSSITSISSYSALKGNLRGYQQIARQVDTSIGGCDVFNPYPQFGLDDDIIHPIHDITPNKDGTAGLGSIYNEMFYDTQKVLYLQMGVPKFSGLSNFFLDDNGTLGTLMKDGKLPLGAKIGQLIGSTGKIMVKLFTWPIQVSKYLGEVLTTSPQVTKYYDFKPAMPLYFRLVNSFFCAISVAMGVGSLAIDPAKTGGVRESPLSKLPNEELPEIMRNGPDIFAILNRRSIRTKQLNPENVTNEYDLLISQQQANNDDSDVDVGMWKKFGAGFDDGMSGVNNWIGFRIEKSADASEAVHNESGESEVGVSLNSMVSSQRSMMFKIQGGDPGSVVPGWAKDAFGFVGDIFTNTVSNFDGNSMVQMATGNGFFDIPHEWKNSSFNKSHNFRIPLRARYGDPVTILQCLYLPLALWLAASSPRAIANNMYTAPFLVQAYVKGLFSVPLGIIETVNIKRGGPEFGWNRTGLPLSLDLDITIKDLSPSMFLSLTDNEVGFLGVAARNTSMLDYISTLAGVGLQSRNSFLHLKFRGIGAAVLNLKNTLFSPYFWGQLVGENMGVFKGIYQMSPWGRTPEKFPPVGRL